MAWRALSGAAVAWLIGVALIAQRWASPLSAVYSRAILADLLFGIAVLLLALEQARLRRWPQWRAWHGWLAAYVAWTVVAAAAAPDRTTAGKTVLLVGELALLAVLAAFVPSRPRVARALARVTLAAVAFTFGLAVLALALFYAGHRTSLLGAYGEQFTPSNTYAR